jgi:hypothetical protein
MRELDQEILNRIIDLRVECPECESMWDDDQYQCGTCGCDGAGNQIAVLPYIKEHGLLNIKGEVLDRIKDLYIECPECESMYSDDQYTCTTCWYEGGGGRLNVYQYLKENTNLI